MTDNIVIDLSKSNNLNSPTSSKNNGETEDKIEKQFNDILDSMGNLKQYITQVQNKIRILEKMLKKNKKIMQKL